MEKRQRLAMLVVLTRYTRWLELRGIFKTTAKADRLLQEYMESLNSVPEERQTPPETD